MSLTSILIAIFSMTLIIFFTRAFPFVIFTKRKPHDLFHFLGTVLPPFIIAILIVYCTYPFFIQSNTVPIKEIIAIAFVVIMHWIKGNTLLSVVGGTVLYMILLHWKF